MAKGMYDREFENMRRDQFYLDSEREETSDRRLLAESFGDDEADDDYDDEDEIRNNENELDDEADDEPEPYYGDDDEDEDGFEREIGDEQPSPTPVLVKCPDCCDNPECCQGHAEGQHTRAHPEPVGHLVKPTRNKPKSGSPKPSRMKPKPKSVGKKKSKSKPKSAKKSSRKKR